MVKSFMVKRFFAPMCCVSLSLAACDPDETQPSDDLGAMDLANMAPDVGTSKDMSRTLPDLGEPEDMGPQLDLPVSDAASDLPDMLDILEGDAGTDRWVAPSCDEVESRAFTFSRDTGATIVPMTGTLSGSVTYTRGLVTLDDLPGVMLGASGSALSVSRDAGCTWQEVGQLDELDAPPVIVAGVEGRAWVHAPNSSTVYRVDVEATRVELTKTAMPEGEDVLGVGSDRKSLDTVYVGTSSGQVHVSRDGGLSFSPQGVPADPNHGGLAYTMKFDASDPSHIVYGMAGAAMVSFNGGLDWSKAEMASVPGGRTNVFSVSIHPTRGDVVWAMGIDIAESLEQPLPSHDGRHIYRSTNGGRTFTVVLDQQPGVVTLVNGPLMLADPADEETLYVVFAGCFQNYGTDLFRVSATGAVNTIHHDVTLFGSIAVSPADSRVLYLGLTREDTRGPDSGCGG